MRAVVIDRFGGPEVLQVRQVPDPEPGPGQVRIAVHASGVNPVETGNRADGSWAGIEPPVVLGYDASGVVDTVGPGVTDWAVGDEVFAMPDILGNRHGSHAEYVVVDAVTVARKPATLSHVEAAAIPLAGGTAYATMALRLAVLPGEWVLIHGAAGGVGSFAVQIAADRGARVIAVASVGHHDELQTLGAEVCIDYRTEDVMEAAVAAAGGPINAVADFVGREAIARSLVVLRSGGRAATTVSLTGDLDLALDRNITIHGVLIRPDRSILDALRDLVERERIRPIVDEVLPLERVADAHRRMESKHGRGKVVLRVR
jgi:NADPH2:quinone reductase